MLKLIIEDDEGRKTVVPFVRDEITIGRQEGNTIRLTERNVSRRHARLVRLNGHVVLEDLGSYNGTRINGERVAGQLPLKEGDLIQIGDYDLALQVEGAAAAAPTGAITAKVPASRRPEPEEEDAPAPSASQDDAEDEEEDDDADGDEHDHTPPSAEARRNATSIIRMDQMEADRPRKVERVPEDEQPRLLVLAPNEFKGQEYDCNRTELRIGRTSENDIALDHRSLSRTHAKVVREATGEWRVIDMQSANGMTVNGESYAQATLSHGDIIEMGHVKLRFVGPGTLSEDLAAQGDRPGSKKLVVGIVVAFLSIAAGAALFVIKGQDLVTPPTDTPPPVVANNPAQVPDKPAATAVGTTPEPPAPETPPEPKATEQDFETALAAADFNKASTVLESLRAGKGLPAGKAKELQGRLNLETQAQQQLAVLEEALKNGKVAEAIAAAKTFPKTVVFASRFEELKKQLQEAQRSPSGEEPEVTTEAQKNSVEATSEYMRGKTAANVKDEIVEIQLEVQRLAKAKDVDAALEIAEDCARLNPKVPECHLLLGVLYAKDKKFKKSEEHYGIFLQIAPKNHDRRARVIELLSNSSSKPSEAESQAQNPPEEKNLQ